MNRAQTSCFALAIGGALVVAGCASHPAPVDAMAGAEGAARAAQEVGADSNPEAQLHLRLAREELARAHQLMANGDNEKADFTLLRARADADLALELTRETQAQAAAKTATDKANNGAPTPAPGVPTSTTTTTSTTTVAPTAAPVVPPAAPQAAPKGAQ